jgi:DNA polymerase III subunit chi
MSALPEVTFHVNVSDTVPYLCRLLRKASQSGLRTLVCLPEDQIEALDQALWTCSPEDFLPHARWDDPVAVRTHSPVLLAPPSGDWAQAEVLVNVHAEMPARVQGLRKLIEVVGTDEASRAAGRRRWKTYSEMGLSLRHHDAAAGAAA